jgi:hypothetical protein
VSVELEAAAADSLFHLPRPHKHELEPGAVCANCGAVLQGPFCHVCGQDSDRHKRSIRHLVFEAMEGMFELDGRLWRTVPALFFRPGRLARDYIEGRIVRHVPPFRMFLVALVLFIFAAEYATHQSTVVQQQKKAAHAALLATPQGRTAEVARIRKEAATDLQGRLRDAANDRADDLKDTDANRPKVEAAYARHVQRAQARYAEALAGADRVAQGLPENAPTPAGAPRSKAWFRTGIRKAVDNPDYYWSVVFTWGHRAAVVLLPVIGLSLALVYRRKKQVFLYDHLLVAMNLLSFSFLTNGLGLVLPLVAMPWWFSLVALWTPVNLFQTLRGAYGSSILGAILKTLVIWTITVTASLFLLSGILVLAIAQL